MMPATYSPQRRRDAEISAEKTNLSWASQNSSSASCGIRLCLVHPSAARTALVGQASACQSERSSDLDPLGALKTHLPNAFSALISASLRLCGESTPSLATTPEAL